MDNLLLLVPDPVCDSRLDIPGVTLKALPPESEGQTAWLSLSEVRALADSHSYVATAANSDASVIREMLGLLDTRSYDLPTAVVCSEEPVPSGLRTSLPECLHRLVRRPQPRDLLLASRNALETAGPGTMKEIALVSGTISKALSRGPDVDRFPLPGPGSSEVHLKVLRHAIRDAVDSLKLGGLDRGCLEAGLLLLWDFPDESHSISQTMEGKGSPRTGDYWHGIMHRREPDPGNASYWFRRVGQHPAFESLRCQLMDWMSELQATAPQLDLVRRKLLTAGEWDPFAMIQLSEQALLFPGSNDDLTCRMVQYLEMLNLLSWSANSV